MPIYMRKNPVNIPSPTILIISWCSIFTAGQVGHKSLNWSQKCRILSFLYFRLMNAELEAKTADIVKQADQLMVRFILVTSVKVQVGLLSGNVKEMTGSAALIVSQREHKEALLPTHTSDDEASRFISNLSFMSFLK